MRTLDLLPCVHNNLMVVMGAAVEAGLKFALQRASSCQHGLAHWLHLLRHNANQEDVDGVC